MQDINIYTHKMVNSRLTIKKEYENIAVCNLIDEPKTYNIHGVLIYKTVIIKKININEENK